MTAKQQPVRINPRTNEPYTPYDGRMRQVNGEWIYGAPGMEDQMPTPAVAASTGPRKPNIKDYLTTLLGPLGGLAGSLFDGGGGRPQGPGPDEMMPGGNPLPNGTGIDAGLPPRAPVLNDAGIDPSQPLPPPPPDPVLDNGPTLEQLSGGPAAPEAIGGVPLPAPPPDAAPPAAPAPPPEARAAPAPMVATAMAARRRPSPVSIAGSSRVNQSGPSAGGNVMGAPRVESLLQYLPKARPGAPRPSWHGWMNR